MKNRNTIFVAELLYLLIMTLCSLFYMFANFDKSISNHLGLVQLIFSIISIIAFTVVSRTKNSGLPVFIYILYSAAQLVAAFCWVMFSYATFHIFPGVVAINWIGLAAHLLLIGWGAGMIIVKRRESIPQSN